MGTEVVDFAESSCHRRTKALSYPAFLPLEVSAYKSASITPLRGGYRGGTIVESR